jgi:hypothetical protein
MAALVVKPGDTVPFDPSDVRVVAFNWDDRSLGVGVTISTSTFTITAIRQIGVTALTKDNPSITGSSRRTQVRLIATTATLGDEYEVANAVVTNESPAQTKEQSFRVLIQHK